MERLLNVQGPFDFIVLNSADNLTAAKAPFDFARVLR